MQNKIGICLKYSNYKDIYNQFKKESLAGSEWQLSEIKLVVTEEKLFNTKLIE